MRVCARVCVVVVFVILCVFCCCPWVKCVCRKYISVCSLTFCLEGIGQYPSGFKIRCTQDIDNWISRAFLGHKPFRLTVAATSVKKASRIFVQVKTEIIVITEGVFISTDMRAGVIVTSSISTGCKNDNTKRFCYIKLVLVELEYPGLVRSATLQHC